MSSATFYRERRDAMASALATYLPTIAHTNPTGGFLYVAHVARRA